MNDENKPIRVGLREFRTNLSKYLYKKVIITDWGKEIGVYVPKYKFNPEIEDDYLKSLESSL